MVRSGLLVVESGPTNVMERLTGEREKIPGRRFIRSRLSVSIKVFTGNRFTTIRFNFLSYTDPVI